MLIQHALSEYCCIAVTMQASADMEGQDLGDVEGMGEDIMKQMMSEFEKLGEKEDYSEVAYTLTFTYTLQYAFTVLCIACCCLHL
jgi:hypothetical protein